MGIYEREGTHSGFRTLFGLSSSATPRVAKLVGSDALLGPGAGANLAFEDSGNIGTVNATRTVLLTRGDLPGSFWEGFLGPLLIYDGTLSAENRDGMFDKLHELSGIEEAE